MSSSSSHTGRTSSRGGLKLIIELEKTAAVDSLAPSLSHSTDLSVASPPHSTKLHDERRRRRRRRKKKKPTNEARRDGRTTCK